MCCVAYFCFVLKSVIRDLPVTVTTKAALSRTSVNFICVNDVLYQRSILLYSIYFNLLFIFFSCKKVTLHLNYCTEIWKRAQLSLEYITLVLIARTLEPISGKSLLLLRSYRLIHSLVLHARTQVFPWKYQYQFK